MARVWFSHQDGARPAVRRRAAGSGRPVIHVHTCVGGLQPERLHQKRALIPQEVNDDGMDRSATAHRINTTTTGKRRINESHCTSRTGMDGKRGRWDLGDRCLAVSGGTARAQVGKNTFTRQRIRTNFIYLLCIGGTETFSKAVETKETAPLCARNPHSSRVLSHSLLGPLAEPPKHRSAERYNNNTQ